MFKELFSKYKDDLDNCKKDLKNIRTWKRQLPNFLTILRPIGMIPANILFFTGNVVPAIVLTGLLLSTDFFDGKLARKWDCQSKLGADLDTVGDKIMFLGMALPLIITNPLMLVNILMEASIALVNVVGRLKGIDTKTVYSGKVKTWLTSITLIIGYLVQFLGVPSSILTALISITAASQGFALGEYIYKYKQMMEEKNNIKLDIKVFDEGKTNDLKIEPSLVETLKREREFVLGMQEPNKVYTGKKRVRKLIHEKRTFN